ncbi:uncharacterized protein ACA1_069060 [Acanthamoeba castellanii str. Neff]|uniref:Uncharacterized protein n=1 Tax=Acanthamoeba castellanii (strain ATCC 30010 / Neff) TaxID=1257118 RepID=L8HDL1_ACACF|nr:uncharacterized protein ACA1_069060 [Acanthamoeba castellanii str. Neff]ELR23322.1 hypothetical protein ACA1_069060 [Acanthamoeba castellanii str. Neff]
MTRHLRPTKPQPRTAPDDRVARYTAASWGQLRLLWVGASDAGSPLSNLPPELVVMIARLAAWRPPCWADSRLRWCRAKAKTSPDGIAQFWVASFADTGLAFDYNHVTRRFKLSEWRKQDTAGAWKDTTLVGFWSEAEFLVNASFDKRWRQWFESMCVDD